jgi:hypothetical protein
MLLLLLLLLLLLRVTLVQVRGNHQQTGAHIREEHLVLACRDRL